jgi:predicted PurR-regulated permease PerM
MRDVTRSGDILGDGDPVHGALHGMLSGMNPVVSSQTVPPRVIFSPEGTTLRPRSVAVATAVVVGVLTVATFVGFVLRDGGAVLFSVLMSWFASIAMEPAVARLSRRMRRGAATAVVMGGVGVLAAFFVLAFGQLLVDQVLALLRALPEAVAGGLEQVNQWLGTAYTVESVLGSIELSSDEVGQYASQLLTGVVGLASSLLGALFSLFTIGLLSFYLSADGPRLRRWIAGLFPAQGQAVFLTVWQTTLEKTGGYVAARLTLAVISGASTSVVFLAIGMPSWLALSVWMGVISQFVPTIGTYLAIVLPVLVGLQSDRPIIGVLALLWAVLYQQVENLALEPRISAKATDVHPAVAFSAVLLVTSLFGVAGALLAVPIVAVILSLIHAYVRRHELVGEPARTEEEGEPPRAEADVHPAPSVAASTVVGSVETG